MGRLKFYNKRKIMENNNDKLNYNILKNRFQIVLEIEKYIVLNNGEIYIKDNNNNLKPASKDDEFAKKIKSLMYRRNEENRIWQYNDGHDLSID